VFNRQVKIEDVSACAAGFTDLWIRAEKIHARIAMGTNNRTLGWAVYCAIVAN
jgi:hypothetical protein